MEVFPDKLLKSTVLSREAQIYTLGKPRTKLYDSFPSQGYFFNTLPHKKHSRRVSFSVSIQSLGIWLKLRKNKCLRPQFLFNRGKNNLKNPHRKHQPNKNHPSPSQNNKLSCAEVVIILNKNPRRETQITEFKDQQPKQLTFLQQCLKLWLQKQKFKLH